MSWNTEKWKCCCEVPFSWFVFKEFSGCMPFGMLCFHPQQAQTVVLSMAAWMFATVSPCSLTSFPSVYPPAPSKQHGWIFVYLFILSAWRQMVVVGGTILAEMIVRPFKAWGLWERNQHMEAEAASTQCRLWPPSALSKEPGSSANGYCWCSVPCFLFLFSACLMI